MFGECNVFLRQILWALFVTVSADGYRLLLNTWTHIEQ